jgi:hypothetical protein
MEPLEAMPIPWAQGVGRSNRPAPTKFLIDSKELDRFLFHRFRLSFASTVPKLGPMGIPAVRIAGQVQASRLPFLCSRLGSSGDVEH